MLQLLGAAVQVAGDMAPAIKLATIDFQLDNDLAKQNGANHAIMLQTLREFAAPEVYYGAPLCYHACLWTRACAHNLTCCRTHVPSGAWCCMQHMHDVCDFCMTCFQRIAWSWHSISNIDNSAIY